MGECVLIIENQERHLRAWDFVHCPPMTAHTFVAKETGPCVILATGNRRDDLERVYRRSEVASAMRQGPMSIQRIPSAEDHGRFGVQHAGTSCRGLNGRSFGGCPAASAVGAAAHQAKTVACASVLWAWRRLGHLWGTRRTCPHEP
jgi:hypothetical protein